MSYIDTFVESENSKLILEQKNFSSNVTTALSDLTTRVIALEGKEKNVNFNLTESEKEEYQRAADALRKLFGNNFNFGIALNCFVNEIVDRRKAKCKHPDIGYTQPDWEGLSQSKDVKSAIASFRYLWRHYFYCHACNSTVYPKEFVTGPKPE